MQKDTNYCYKGSDGFVIENGLLIGPKVSYLTKHNSFGEFILERMRSTPEFIGQVDGLTGKEENFALMTEKSVKCAMWLRDQNVKPGDVIGICTHIQMDTYVPCLASLFVGAVFNPWWNVGITEEVISYFLTLTRPKMVFADEATAELIAEVVKKVEIAVKVVVLGSLTGLQSLTDILATQKAKSVSDFRCTKLSSVDDPSAIVYTSGSTGLPKGALYSQKTLFANVQTFNDMGEIEGTRISMTFSTLAWLTGLLSMLRGTIAPETRIICSDFSEEIALRLIEKFKVNWTLMGTSPTVRIQKSPVLSNYDLSSLKYFYVGGSVMKEETQKAMNVSFPHTKVLQIYGSTEMGGVVLQQSSENPKLGSCGKVRHNITMKVIDVDSGTILGPNQAGEACFKYPCMMLGFYNNPKATRETVDAEGWLHSGDIVHYDEEGDVYVTDRMKEMIKYKGYQVSPAMVEEILHAHPEISEAAVVPVPHAEDDEHPIAFVSRTPNARVTEEDIQKLVADKLPDYMKLRGGVRFLTVLPHTTSGKVARRELKQLAQTGKAS